MSRDNQEQPTEPYSAATDAMRDLAHNFANTAYHMGYDHGYELGFAAGELTPRNIPGPSSAVWEASYNALKIHYTELKTQHAALNREMLDLVLEHDQLKTDFDKLRDSHSGERLKVDHAKTDYSLLCADYNQLSLDNEKLRDELEHAKKVYAEAFESGKAEGYTAGYDIGYKCRPQAPDLTDILSERDNTIRELRDSLAEAHRANDCANANRIEAQSAREDLIIRNRTISAQLAELATQNAVLHSANERGAAGLEQRLARHEVELARLISGVKERDAEIERLKTHMQTVIDANRKEAAEDAYAQGYEEGKVEGYINGHDTGHEAGFKAASAENTDLKTRIDAVNVQIATLARQNDELHNTLDGEREDGYAQGFKEGHDQGYAEGAEHLSYLIEQHHQAIDDLKAGHEKQRDADTADWEKYAHELHQQLSEEWRKGYAIGWSAGVKNTLQLTTKE